MSFSHFHKEASDSGLKLFVETRSNLKLYAVMKQCHVEKRDFFWWESPDRKTRFIAVDRLINIRENGKERADLSDTPVQAILSGLQTNSSDFFRDPPPVFVGSMSFSYGQSSTMWKDFADSDWFIPRFIFMERDGQCYFLYFYEHSDTAQNEYEKGVFLALSTQLPKEKKYRIHETSKGTFNSWEEKINTILNLISQNDISKIVLSRYIKFILDADVFPGDLTRILSDRYPRCYIFIIKHKDSIFFGASPEKLASLHQGVIEADALAGSMPRGDTKPEDDRLGKELLESEKNLAEQQAVVDFIASSFDSFTCDLSVPENPVLRKLPNIQHLWTPIKGRLCEGSGIFQILKLIHPTPAICGVPWKRARKHIMQIEDYPRGLYTGLVGWFGSNDEADFAVSIRSALIKDRELWAFAGCGIVKGSDAESEFQESELKLKPISLLFDHDSKGQ